MNVLATRIQSTRTGIWLTPPYNRSISRSVRVMEHNTYAQLIDLTGLGEAARVNRDGYAMQFAAFDFVSKL